MSQETKFYYRVREYGPKSHRFFQVEMRAVDSCNPNWYSAPFAPDFSNLADAKAWIADEEVPQPEEVFHPYP